MSLLYSDKGQMYLLTPHTVGKILSPSLEYLVWPAHQVPEVGPISSREQ